jgi:ketosteroid isomerase-like protein
MHKFLLVITLLTAGATAAFTQTTAKPAAPTGNAEQAVLQMTQAWLDADERQDRAALDKIIADDFLGTTPGGRTVNKQDVIPEEGKPGRSLSINTQDLKVRIFGDTAVVDGRGVPKTQEGGVRPELRFTVVFVKRADRWQMVEAHLSRVPKD